MASKRNISFIKPPEPEFIRKMKEKIGYQEPDTVETKRQKLMNDADDQTELDDEKPVIVTLKTGDLTEEEFEKEMASSAEYPNKKFVFSRPSKRDSDESNPLMCSSKKNTELKKRVQDRSEKSPQIKNSSLLSFNEDEEDEDD